MTVLGIATALMLGAVAGAVGTTVVKRNFNVHQVDTGGGSVACPQGKDSTSGGFTLQQTDTSLEVQASHPTRKGWSVEVRNIEHAKRSGTVIALCKKGQGLSIRTKKHTTDQADTDVQVTAKCPDGSKAVGGGGELTGGEPAFGNAFQIGSFPASAGHAWATRWRFPSGGEVDLKAYAICDENARGYNVVEDDDEIQAPEPPYFGDGTALATCKGHDKLAGGGYFRSDEKTYYTKIGPKGSGWNVTANGFVGGPILSFAICVN